MPPEFDRPVAAIILAAGKSTRMRSRIPKPLHPICGLPVTAHVIRACRSAGIARIVVVVGHEADAVKAGLGDDVEYALQTTQRGTGDAVNAAKELLGDWPGTIVVLVGDMPLLPPASLQTLLSQHGESRAAASLLTALSEDATGYGRIVRDSNGSFLRIVEQKDASPDEQQIREWNPSIYAFDGPELWRSLSEVQPNNAQGEFYLTDTPGILAAQGRPVVAIPAADSRLVVGINNRVELASVAEIMRRQILTDLMLSGVSITDPASTYIDVDVTIGQDTVIEPNTYLLRGTTIGENCVIGPSSRIAASTLGSNVRVVMSQVTESVLGDGVRVGPFAHLRPNSRLAANVKIGDFVEVKNATLGVGAQASHLSYIGDADIGAGVNIGAGAITCNYDGLNKHRTVIGEGAFIGSNSTLIAPITIGAGAFVAAGSPLNEDAPPGALAVARVRPTIKPDWAAKRKAESGKQ